MSFHLAKGRISNNIQRYRGHEAEFGDQVRGIGTCDRLRANFSTELFSLNSKKVCKILVYVVVICI